MGVGGVPCDALMHWHWTSLYSIPRAVLVLLPWILGLHCTVTPLAPAPLDMGSYCKGPCWWYLVTKTEDLFKLVHLRTPPPHPPLLAPGIENAHKVSASGWYVSYWNAFLVYIFSMAHPRFRGRKRPTQEEVQTYFKPVFSKKLARKWNQIYCI